MLASRALRAARSSLSVRRQGSGSRRWDTPTPDYFAEPDGSKWWLWSGSTGSKDTGHVRPHTQPGRATLGLDMKGSYGGFAAFKTRHALRVKDTVDITLPAGGLPADCGLRVGVVSDKYRSYTHDADMCGLVDVSNPFGTRAGEVRFGKDLLVDVPRVGFGGEDVQCPQAGRAGMVDRTEHLGPLNYYLNRTSYHPGCPDRTRVMLQLTITPNHDVLFRVVRHVVASVPLGESGGGGGGVVKEVVTAAKEERFRHEAGDEDDVYHIGNWIRLNDNLATLDPDQAYHGLVYLHGREANVTASVWGRQEYTRGSLIDRSWPDALIGHNEKAYKFSSPHQERYGSQSGRFNKQFGVLALSRTTPLPETLAAKFKWWSEATTRNTGKNKSKSDAEFDDEQQTSSDPPRRDFGENSNGVPEWRF